MKVLYVNSGPSPIHESLDRYIDLTFSEMDIDYRFFDLTAHVKYFETAFDLVKEEHDIDYSISALNKYAASPLLELVGEFEPDLVFTTRGNHIPKGIVESIKNTGSITALWVVDDPFSMESALESAKVYDYVFTVESASVSAYLAAGCKNVFHLPLAAYPKVHKKNTSPQHESDICLIGPGLNNRIELFDEIADYLVDAGLKVRIIGHGWGDLREYDRLKKLISDKAIHAADASKYYAGAKINLNIPMLQNRVAYIHDDESKFEAVSPNRKTFEIAACGGFQLISDIRPELGNYFEIGREVEEFSSPEDLIEKIEYYLQNEEKREEMAELSRERCLKEHSFLNRLDLVLEKTLTRDTESVISQIVSSSNNRQLRNISASGSQNQKINKLIAQNIPQTAKLVLDVGCGEGTLSDMHGSHGPREICGVEINEVVAEKARNRLDKVIVGDVEEVELPFRNNSFDCIIYANVLEYLRDPWKLLAKQKKFLATDGLVVASISNNLYFPVIKELLEGGRQYDGDGSTGQIRFFALREIAHMFKSAGYEIEKIEGVTNGLSDLNEASAFVKRLRPLNILSESLLFETQYVQYLVVARKVKSAGRQGASLSLVRN